MLSSLFGDVVVQAWLATAAWAGGVALVVLLLGLLGGAARAAPAAALALGFAAAHVTVDGMPAFPPDSRWQWSAWLALAALLLLFVEEGRGAQALLRFLLLCALVGALVWFQLLQARSVQEALDAQSDLVARLVPAGAVLLLAFGLLGGEARAAGGPAWRILLGMAIATGALAACVARTHSLKIGQAGFGLATALAVNLLVSCLPGGAALTRTTSTVAALAFLGLLAVPAGSRQLPLSAVAALLASFASAFVPARATGTLRNVLLALALALLPALVAAFTAGVFTPPAE